jgi:hypothetical protein
VQGGVGLDQRVGQVVRRVDGGGAGGQGVEQRGADRTTDLLRGVRGGRPSPAGRTGGDASDSSRRPVAGGAEAVEPATTTSSTPEHTLGPGGLHEPPARPTSGLNPDRSPTTEHTPSTQRSMVDSVSIFNDVKGQVRPGVMGAPPGTRTPSWRIKSPIPDMSGCVGSGHLLPFPQVNLESPCQSVPPRTGPVHRSRARTGARPAADVLAPTRVADHARTAEPADSRSAVSALGGPVSVRAAGPQRHTMAT